MSDSNDNRQEVGLLPITLREFEIVVRKDQAGSGELTVANLEKWAQEKLVAKAEDLAPKLFAAWENAMAAGDSKVMRDVAEALRILQPKGGISVNTQINNNNSNVTTNNSGGISLESIIRKRDEARQRKDRSEIIDAEIIEDDGSR
jgi:hypothetical protein